MGSSTGHCGIRYPNHRASLPSWHGFSLPSYIEPLDHTPLKCYLLYHPFLRLPSSLTYSSGISSPRKFSAGMSESTTLDSTVSVTLPRGALNRPPTCGSASLTHRPPWDNCLVQSQSLIYRQRNYWVILTTGCSEQSLDLKLGLSSVSRCFQKLYSNSNGC